MKLYGITVEFELLVAAENEDEAAELALENADEELRNMGDQPDISVEEVTDVKRIPKSWRQCYPYREDRTTAQSVEAYLPLSQEGCRKP